MREPSCRRGLEIFPCIDWNWKTIAAEGGDVELALRLADAMQRIGLSIEQARGEAILLQPVQPSFLSALAQMMLRITERGVASAEQVNVETLAQRIEAEHGAVGGIIVWDLAFLIAARSK